MASTIQIDRLLETTVRRNASDLHLAVGRPPTLRMGGHLRELQTKVLEPEDTTALTASDWVLVTGDEAIFEQLRAEGVGEEVQPKPGLRPWTDDYSNLLRIVQFRPLGEDEQ